MIALGNDGRRRAFDQLFCSTIELGTKVEHAPLELVILLVLCSDIRMLRRTSCRVTLIIKRGAVWLGGGLASANLPIFGTSWSAWTSFPFRLLGRLLLSRRLITWHGLSVQCVWRFCWRRRGIASGILRFILVQLLLYKTFIVLLLLFFFFLLSTGFDGGGGLFWWGYKHCGWGIY